MSFIDESESHFRLWSYGKPWMYMSVFGIGYLESSDVFLLQSLNAVITVSPQPYGRGFFISKVTGSIYLSGRLML